MISTHLLRYLLVINIIRLYHGKILSRKNSIIIIIIIFIVIIIIIIIIIIVSIDFIVQITRKPLFRDPEMPPIQLDHVCWTAVDHAHLGTIELLNLGADVLEATHAIPLDGVAKLGVFGDPVGVGVHDVRVFVVNACRTPDDVELHPLLANITAAPCALLASGNVMETLEHVDLDVDGVPSHFVLDTLHLRVSSDTATVDDVFSGGILVKYCHFFLLLRFLLLLLVR